jgi:hypothetical protein
MRGERIIEVAQAIGGDHGDAGGCEDRPQGVDQAVRRLQPARAQGQRRDQPGLRVERQPEPGHALAQPQLRPDLVQLYMGEVQMV